MSRSPNDWHDHDYRTPADDAAPSGHWHPGMGAHPADRGYAGPGGSFEGLKPHVCGPEAGYSVRRKDTQSADPVIKDKANRRNVQAHASERYGPAGRVQMSRAYSDPAPTGRNVRILPSAFRGA